MRWSKDRFRRWWVLSPLVDWAPAVSVLVGYGLIRLVVTAAVVSRHGGPSSVLGWSGAISSVAAAGQAFAVAALLPAARRRRPVLAGTITAAGVSTALLDATMWVVIGNASDPMGYAWQLVLAVAFGVAAMVLCRSGIGSIWDASGYKLAWITRATLWTGGVAAAVAGSAGAALALDQSSVVDRFLRMTAVVGLAGLVSATVVVIPVVQERWRRRRKAQVADFYRLLNAVDSAD